MPEDDRSGGTPEDRRARRVRNVLASSRTGRPLRHTGDVALNGSTWLLLAKMVQMGSGFVFWALAARTFTVSDVGVATSAASAVMLCTHLGILGTGAAITVRLSQGHDAEQALDVALTLMLLAAFGVAVACVVLARTLGGTPEGFGLVLSAAAFVVSAMTGTVVLCLEYVSVALRQAAAPLVRYLVGVVLSVSALGAVALVGRGREVGALGLFACWSVASVVAGAVGMWQLRGSLQYRYRPSLHLAAVRSVLGVGVPNQLLTITERLTPALVPVIISYVASPTVTARWYLAWMMAWAAFQAPLMAGMVQFAEALRSPEDLGRTLRRGVVWSLAVGGALAAGLALAAPVLLSLLGEGYADASTPALRILLLGLVAMSVVQAYNAACRALGRHAEGVTVGFATSALVCASTAVFAPQGVTAVAWAWLASMTLAAAVAAIRLGALARNRAGRAPHHPVVLGSPRG